MQQISDTRRQHARFTGAGTGQNHGGFTGQTHGGFLFGIEFIEEANHHNHYLKIRTKKRI